MAYNSKKTKLYDEKQVINWALDNDLLNSSTFFLKAAENGNIEALRWALSKDYMYDDESVVKKAIEFGQLETYKWLINNKFPYNKRDCAETAGKHGHLEILKFFLAEDKDPTLDYDVGFLIMPWEEQYFDPKSLNTWNNTTWTTTAENGHLEILQWIYENNISKFNCFTVQAAYRQNHIHILKWLEAINVESYDFDNGSYILRYLRNF